jgi:formylglycine-generating enzyme required for sulfatase activity
MRNTHHLLSLPIALALCGCAEPDTPDTGPVDTGPVDTSEPFECVGDIQDELGMAMVAIPAGTFTMGSPDSELGRVEELEVLHEVTLTHDFLLGQTEITQAQYQARAGTNPAAFQGCGEDCPVESVSWNQAAVFTNLLSDEAGLENCYSCEGEGDELSGELSSSWSSIYACPGYRLPTEAEWEYAVRAGTDTAFSNGGDLLEGTENDCEGELALDNGLLLDRVDWYCGSTGNDMSRAVGLLRPNSWCLHDVHGNVWEWSHDGMTFFDGTTATDPFGRENEEYRVFRGGGWTDHPRATRSANRRADPRDFVYDYLGLRVARTVAP